jgi:predicted AlkP superfamily pyrophosphatase or phosphodiesterase
MRRKRFTVVSVALLALASVTMVSAPGAARAAAPAALASKAIFFGSDGMRPDLMETYVAAGQMPTYADLIAKGVRGDNGMT